jgi:hypothetical protein
MCQNTGGMKLSKRILKDVVCDVTDGFEARGLGVLAIN